MMLTSQATPPAAAWHISYIAGRKCTGKQNINRRRSWTLLKYVEISISNERRWLLNAIVIKSPTESLPTHNRYGNALISYIYIYDWYCGCSPRGTDERVKNKFYSWRRERLNSLLVYLLTCNSSPETTSVQIGPDLEISFTRNKSLLLTRLKTLDECKTC